VTPNSSYVLVGYMLRKVWCCILLAALLCGCTVVDTIDPRIDLTNRQTARARDQAVLLNIVRANHNLPLNFVAFSRVSGTQSASLSLAAPTFLLGAGPSPLSGIGKQEALINNTTLGTTGTLNNAFDLTVLDSHDFYSALLSPVELPTLEYFVRQGYSRELLFWLFTDSVRVSGPGMQPIEFRNELNYHRDRNVNCGNPHKLLGKIQCFDEMVAVAVLSGLRSESKVIQKSSSGGEGGRSTVGTSGGQQKPQTITYGRLCFDTFAATRAGQEYPETLQEKLLFRGLIPSQICGSRSWNPEKEQKAGSNDTLTFDLLMPGRGTVQFEIVTRSTFGIYQFLGSILRENAMDQVKISGPRGYKEDPHLLAVRTFPSPEPCFVELAFEEHEYFCVPQKGAENTKRIFSILVQLIALKTQAGDLSITPLVRVTP
jgi:hypothetical protein